ncbi:hypothetical protein Bca4012_084955 [Brassica carinata]
MAKGQRNLRYPLYPTDCISRICLSRKIHASERSRKMIRSKLAYSEEEVAVKKKTILVGRLPKDTGISDIIDFFKDVGQVVRVQLIAKPWLRTSTRSAFVKFASSNEAEKAAQKLDNLQIFGQIFDPYRLPVPNIDYFSYVGEVVRVRLIVNPEGKHVGYGFVEFDSADAAHKALELMNGEYLLDHMLFLDVAKLPPYRLRHNVDFYKDVGQFVHVRLVTNCEGEQMGYGYIEFASAKEAEKALKRKYMHGQKLFRYPAEKFANLPRPMYEDQLGRENRLIDEEMEEGFDETHHFAKEVALRKKTLFVYNLSPNVTAHNISTYYKNVGEVCRVRFVVNREGEHVGCGFVEFASAVEVKEALLYQSRCLNMMNIISDVVEMSPYPIRPKRNEEYLLPESLPIEEDYLEKPGVTKLFCGTKITFSEDD